jgi:GT2 family glycosyltransferase
MLTKILKNTTTKPLLSFVIVNYNSKKYLPGCVNSITAALFVFPYEIIIVNNDSKPLILPNTFPPIVILEKNNNIGFAKACNAGARIAKGDLVCFLNPDTEILPKQNIMPLLGLLLENNFSIIGPKLFNDITSQKPQPWSAGVKITPWNIIKNNLGIVESKKIWNSKKTISADWVSGASMFVKKEDFLLIGGFDENFFMYYEDVDFCKRMLLQKNKIAYFPHYAVLHFSGKSSQEKSLQKSLYFEAQDYYLKKHFGRIIYFFSKILRKIRFSFLK